MGSAGLGLGQIPFPSSYASRPAAERRDLERCRSVAPERTQSDSPEPRIGPMFELAAGRLQRPLKERSSLLTTLLSSVVHGAIIVVVFVLVSTSQRLALPRPHEASHLIAVLVAAPSPPPPPAAPAPTPPPARSEPPPEPQVLPSPQPDLDLAISTPTPEETVPKTRLAAAPPLAVGFGSGTGAGSGFGVEGGVGWGTSASGPPAEPVRVGESVASPKLLHRVEPVYPTSAVASRVEGTVVVEATVDERGYVQDVRVLRSIGPLDEAAREAVMQWRYSPLRVNDQPAQFILTVHVSFRLH